ncbi:acetate--CoA ligase family protein [Ramlibacter sp.]|uniref:acetate--CoA ligase family protein n=1 Tax=Ramlibacter sp. TaxID=1917967 RepID=UPI002C8A71B3|nr:acetate--CoA ligase family protein [Ramlibacter sp.]HWI82126.1 acetate--CoA ligase family protein [Ramlibacter sp.]
MTALPTRGAALADSLLRPRSIAIVGASDDPGKNSGRPLRFLRQAGFAGRLYPVNPRRTEVQGERAWPSLAALPEVPEHVYVLTPTETVPETVAECARLGVKVVSVLASGFSEAGPEGAAREHALRQLARETGIRILGPSSLGVINPRNRMVLTGNAAFAEPDVPAGRIFVASHSGSMIGALVSRGRARGVGFAGLVSVGNEVDLSVGEICAATLDDPDIEGYVLFLESLHHGAALRSFALEAARRGKPVVAYKLGRSAAAAEMAATHTGALAGEDDIADAFLKDCGVARVGILEALMECQPLAARLPLRADRPAPHRVGVVTTTGGGAAMAVDQLGIRGIDAQPASAKTLAKFAAAGIAVAPGRVLDLTLAGTKYDTMKAALEIMLAAPEFDLVLAVVGSSARMQPQLAVKPIIDCAASAKPLAAMIVPEAPQAIAQLTAANVPCFRSPEACADVIAAVFARRSPAASAAVAAAPARGAAATLSEAQAYELFDRVGVPHAPSVLAAIDGEAPRQLPFGYPVAVKVCSAAIPHKTEVGGVVLGVADRDQLQAALATLRANLAQRAPGIAAGQALIQPMCEGLGEVLVGYKVDADAGPIVMLAAGGVWAEVMRDRSIRLAPVSVAAARDMIGELRSLKTLAGLRGRQRGDLEALARAISALSQLALRPELGVAEAEINPLLVLPEGQGVLAVDALVLAS